MKEHKNDGTGNDKSAHANIKRAVCCGSFDPVTIGHIGVIHRAAAIFDEVYVAVANNTEKRYMFTLEERCLFVKKAFEGCDNIKVEAVSGFISDYAISVGATAIVKGVRNNADFEFEMLQAQVNSELVKIDTIFLPALGEYAFVCSLFLRELISGGKDFRKYVPPEAYNEIHTASLSKVKSK